MFGEKFSSATGVFMHFEGQGVTPRTAATAVARARGHVFDWPLPGFGQRCAACIVIESGGHPDAA